MAIREVVSELNIVAQAKKYGIPWWQHPQFLFLVLGVIIALSSILSYLLGRRYIADPHIVALLIIVFTAVSLTVAFLITRSFERLAQVARLKSEFVNIVSHQLRSPLSNLKWTLEVLMGSGRAPSPASAKNEEYFRILKENSERMQELVNDLLLASKIEEGKLERNLKEFSFAELVKDVQSQFLAWTKAANIEVEVQGEQNLSRVVSDPSLVRQVLENLFDNAVRYAWKGKGEGIKNTIVVRYARQGGELKIEVQDNGVGIPSGDQRYIFQRFFRSKNAVRQETQGSGLGLYIAKAMVKSLGGDIGFSSQEDKGSTFWFTIPIT